VTRRSFLRQAIALGGGLTLASLVAPAGAPAVAAYAAAGQTQPVTIKFWKSPHSDVEQERVGKVIQGFEAQYPNIQVEHTITDWPSWDETYTAAFASGSPPDVAYMPDQYFVKFAEAKQVADLSQWTEASDYASEKAAWYPDSWATGEYKGTRVAIPNIGVGFLTYYNVDMWKQLGLPDAPPQTLDQLVQVAQAGTQGDNWGYVNEGTNKESAYFWNFQYFHNNGADFFNQDLTANGFNNDGGMAAFQFVTDLFTKYKVTPALGAYTQDEQKDLFKGGKALMLQHEITRLGDFEISNLPFKYDGFLSPRGTVAQTSFGNYGYFLIAEASQHKQESWDFIRYFTGAEVLGPYAEAHGFLLMRKDYPMFQNDPFKKRILDMVAPAVVGFRLHPKLREVLNGMWTEFEAALTGSTDARTALQSAADKVDSVLNSP
jgi:multiple sugar transport system substrate-binding protein